MKETHTFDLDKPASDPGGSGCKCASHRTHTGRGNRKSEQNSNVHSHKALLLSAKTADFLGYVVRI